MDRADTAVNGQDLASNVFAGPRSEQQRCALQIFIVTDTAQRRMPNNITVALDLQNVQPGETCLISGKSFSIPLPINGLPLPTSADRNWTVGVTDTNAVSNQAGYLVGWSMKVEGLE